MQSGAVGDSVSVPGACGCVMRFDQVVSLGGWCVVTEHMRRLDIVGPSSPFDYVGFEFDRLIDCIMSDAEGLGEEVFAEGAFGSAFCKRYECVLTHEFRRDDDYKSIIDAASVSLCARRLKRRWSALKRACATGAPTLFVRVATFGDARRENGYAPDAKEMTNDDVERLAAALELRFPDLPFAIAVVYYKDIHPAKFSAGDRFIPYCMPLPDFDSLRPDMHWAGDPDAWERFADALTLPRRSGCSPASAASLLDDDGHVGSKDAAAYPPNVSSNA